MEEVAAWWSELGNRTIVHEEGVAFKTFSSVEHVLVTLLALGKRDGDLLSSDAVSIFEIFDLHFCDNSGFPSPIGVLVLPPCSSPYSSCATGQ